MRTSALLCLALLLSTACARNQENETADPNNAETARIRDTTLTAKDTLAPADTLPHIRDSLPDSTRSGIR
jgi:hypothetical protein